MKYVIRAVIFVGIAFTESMVNRCSVPKQNLILTAESVIAMNLDVEYMRKSHRILDNRCE